MYQHGKVISENFRLDEVLEHLAKKDAVVWIDLAAPTRDVLDLVAKETNLHVLPVEDALEVRQRPKLDQYIDHSSCDEMSDELINLLAQGRPR